jgi:hypothetical protein
MVTPFGLTAQAISHQPLTAETWLTSLIKSCGICSGQSGTGIDLSLCTLVWFSHVSTFPLSVPFHCRYLSTVPPLSLVHPLYASSWQHHYTFARKVTCFIILSFTSVHCQQQNHCTLFLSCLKKAVWCKYSQLDTLSFGAGKILNVYFVWEWSVIQDWILACVHHLVH